MTTVVIIGLVPGTLDMTRYDRHSVIDRLVEKIQTAEVHSPPMPYQHVLEKDIPFSLPDRRLRKHLKLTRDEGDGRYEVGAE